MITELVIGFAAEDLMATGRIDLADSALHAPQAGFDDQDFYPDICDKPPSSAGASLETIPYPMATNGLHGLPPTLFIDLNDGQWTPDPPDVDDAERTMVAVTAGEIDKGEFAEWLRDRVTFRVTAS